MPPVGFEPTISAGERPQTYALDRAATGTGKENITMYFKETEFEDVYCIHLSQDQCNWRSVVNALLDLWVP